MQALTYFVNTVKTLIEANNTTTSSFDVSSGLTTRVQLVNLSSPAAGLTSVEFPAIFLQLSEYSEELGQMGSGSNCKRKINFTVSTYPATQVGVGLGPGAAEAETENVKLVSNLVTLFRNYIDLDSGDEIWVKNINVDFNQEFDNTIYCKVAKIDISGEALWAAT
jgi:hypothetical protein